MVKKKALPIREVDILPEEAVENEIILNKSDECLYVGVKTSKGTITIMKKEARNGDNMEKDSL